jgi:hypothetical protein
MQRFSAYYSEPRKDVFICIRGITDLCGSKDICRRLCYHYWHEAYEEERKRCYTEDFQGCGVDYAEDPSVYKKQEDGTFLKLELGMRWAYMDKDNYRETRPVRTFSHKEPILFLYYRGYVRFWNAEIFATDLSCETGEYTYTAGFRGNDNHDRNSWLARCRIKVHV